VAAPLPFSESELRLLGALLEHKVRFTVVGLSAATLQGAPVLTQDVDLWFQKLGEEDMLLDKKHPAVMPCINGSFELLLGTGRAESAVFDFQSRHVGHNRG
jgi:hypothetical protein